MELKLDVKLESDLLDKIDLDGKTYYKVKDNVEIDRIIEETIKDKLFKTLYFDFNGKFKELSKKFCDENKEAIIDHMCNESNIEVERVIDKAIKAKLTEMICLKFKYDFQAFIEKYWDDNEEKIVKDVSKNLLKSIKH